MGWFAAGIGSLTAISLVFAEPTDSDSKAGTPVSPSGVAPTTAAAAPAALAATVPMPDLVGKSYTAGSAAIVALGIFAQIDLQEDAVGVCTETPTASLPIARTDPAAGVPLARDGGVKVTLFVDRRAGRPCAPPPPSTTTVVAPPPVSGNTTINPPNVNLPNPNLPNLNPCRHTKWC